MNSKIENICVPIVVPKRSRGHIEVLGCCSVTVSGTKLLIEAVEYIQKISQEPCTQKFLIRTSDGLRLKLKATELVFDLSFLFSMERVSHSGESIFYHVPCVYSVSSKEKSTIITQGIEYPVFVSSAIPLRATLSFSLKNPTRVSFEDMMDHIQKEVGVVVAPICNEKDKSGMSNAFKTVTPGSILDCVAEGSKRKDLGIEGVATIRYTDEYDMYKFSYSTTW